MIRIIPKWILCIIVVSSACTAFAAEPNAELSQALAKRLQKFVDDKTVAGLVVVAGNKEGIGLQAALGHKNIAAGEKMPADALFRIASMTKPVTAMGIMILAEEGKLAIDDPVEKHLPEFQGQMLAAERSAERPPANIILRKPSRPITIKDLLTHTSGIPNFPPGLANIYSARNHTLAEMVMATSQQPLEFDPGSRWAYCNPGIDTLGRIIEVVSGQPYEEFLERRIFTPLDMKDTTFYPTEEQLKRLATLYASKDGELVEAGFTLLGQTTKAKHPIPAGGLYSTASDLARLYQCCLRGGSLDGQKILSEQSLRKMAENHTGDMKAAFTPGMGMGLGFQVVREPQGVTEMLKPGAHGHGGAFGTQGWIDPAQDRFFILLIQRSGLPNADGSDLRKEFQQAVIDLWK